MNPSLPRSTPEEQGVESRAVLALLDAVVASPELHAMRKREMRRMGNSYSLFGGNSTVPIR